jgi:hypothetical protein
MKRLFSLLVATPLLAVPAIAVPAHAARMSVEITSPADGSSGYATDLTVSGRATGSTLVWVTVEGDINTYDAYVYKSQWSTHINELPAGPTTICAEIRDGSGTALAKDCNAFTVTADPSRLEIAFPEEGSVHGESVWVAVQCVAGTIVRLTMDSGEPVDLACEWGVERTYTDLAEGSHTVTASMIDQGAVVATRTRTFTVDLPDPGTVSILSPADGSSGYVGPVTISGTASSWNDGVYLFTDGGETHITSIDETGNWEVTHHSLSLGSHTICAAVKDTHFEVEAEDCITYTVQIDPASLTIDSPEEGTTHAPYLVTVNGGCWDGTTVRLSLDGSEPIELSCTGSYQQEFYGLSDGTHVITATMLHDGSVIATRDRSFAVDATAPAAPVVTSPSTKKTITVPTLPLVGTAEPGSTVEALTADEYYYISTPVADDGSWSLTLDHLFFEWSGALSGQRTKMTVLVAAIDAYGNRSPANSYTYTVHIR